MSDISIGLRHPIVEFRAADSAPSPEEALSALVPNHLGNFALRGFTVDSKNSDSEVRLDTSVQPPILYLQDALTSTVHGYIDAATGAFKPYGGHVPEIPHVATGEYIGPGSVLEIK